MKKLTIGFAVACLGLFLVSFTITVVKPGMPPTLKADEPAYFLMALSLLHDGDLECETGDYRRLFDTFYHWPTDNLILMSDDGWKTVFFGKPYLYSLLGVPFVALFGTNGLLTFNMVLFVALIWMGAVYLGRFNPEPLAFLFSLAFFLFSPTFAYVFWLQPELLNMASVTASVFLVLHRFERPETVGGGPTRLWRVLFNESTQPAWSGALLAFAAYNKPVLGAVAVPLLYFLWRRDGLKSAVKWCVASFLVMGIITGISVALTGHPTAYLGVARSGVKVQDPENMAPAIAEIGDKLETLSTTANSWSWMFDSPPFYWPDFFEDLGYFFWGRHTGFFLYLPFASLAFLLFLLARRKSPTRWLLIATAFGLALFFIVKIPLNWHGGAGFIGNRYFINVYPLFLFLVTAIRPLWLLPVGCLLGGLFLGPIVFTPFGAPVPEPTLQAHVRSLPYRLFPLELSIRRAVPGYAFASFSGVSFVGRRDVFKAHQPEEGVMWVQGAVRSEILVLSEAPVDSLFFEVRTWRPDNRVLFDFAGAESDLRFVDAHKSRKRNQTIELKPGKVSRITHESGKSFHVYNLWIDVENAARIADRKRVLDVFNLGVQLRYLGRRDQVGAPQHYRLEWVAADVPATVGSGELFEVPVRAINRCYASVSSDGPLPVKLGYHWINAQGERLVFGGRRSRFEGTVAPGDELAATMMIRAPERPGQYRLVLDAVRENVSWFSQLGGETHEARVVVSVTRSGKASTGP